MEHPADEPRLSQTVAVAPRHSQFELTRRAGSRQSFVFSRPGKSIVPQRLKMLRRKLTYPTERTAAAKAGLDSAQPTSDPTGYRDQDHAQPESL